MLAARVLPLLLLLSYRGGGWLGAVPAAAAAAGESKVFLSSREEEQGEGQAETGLHDEEVMETRLGRRHSLSSEHRLAALLRGKQGASVNGYNFALSLVSILSIVLSCSLVASNIVAYGISYDSAVLSLGAQLLYGYPKHMQFRYGGVELESAVISYPSISETLEAQEMLSMLSTIEERLDSFVKSLDEGGDGKSFSVYLHPQMLDRIVVQKKRERGNRFLNDQFRFYSATEHRSETAGP